MAKKNFDDFVSSVETPKKMTAEEAAKMVALVHATEAPKPTEKQKKTVEKASPSPQKATPKAIDSAPSPARRGRPRTVRNETERLYRLSVDLPGSLLLKLKGAAMQSETDMKTYVRNLLEVHLAKK